MRDCWAALRKNTFIQNAFHNFLPTQRKHTHTHTHTHIRVYVYTKIVAPCVCIHENRGPVLAISKATKCQKGLLRNPPFRAKFLYTYTNTHTHAHTHTSCNKMRIFLEPVFLPLSGRERWPV